MNNPKLKIAGILLLLIAGVMIGFGIKKKMPPPILTGAGFIVIATIFLATKEDDD